MRYRTVLFDLFGTLILFKPQASMVQIAGTRWVSTMEWLRAQMGDAVPQLAFEDFVQAMAATTEEIVRDRPPEYIEILSQERFRRALARVGIAGSAGARMAEQLSLRHMEYLASTTFMPPAHATLLARLGQRHAIGLVSNFDHAPTALGVLRENAIDHLLRVTIISADFGRRKPHPSIFHAALDALGTAPHESIYIGDTLLDDVEGARAAGMDVVWINPSGASAPGGNQTPTHVVKELAEIEALLA